MVQMKGRTGAVDDKIPRYFGMRFASSLIGLPNPECGTHLIVHGPRQLPLLGEAVVLSHVVACSANMWVLLAESFPCLRQGLLVVLLRILMLFLQPISCSSLQDSMVFALDSTLAENPKSHGASRFVQVHSIVLSLSLRQPPTFAVLHPIPKIPNGSIARWVAGSHN